MVIAGTVACPFDVHNDTLSDLVFSTTTNSQEAMQKYVAQILSIYDRVADTISAVPKIETLRLKTRGSRGHVQPLDCPRFTNFLRNHETLQLIILENGSPLKISKNKMTRMFKKVTPSFEKKAKRGQAKESMEIIDLEAIRKKFRRNVIQDEPQDYFEKMYKSSGKCSHL